MFRQRDALYPGGETEGLARMERHLKRTKYIATFAKPETSPNALEPATTVLSPYLKFGCVSARTFYHALQRVYDQAKKQGTALTAPPVSLHGQMLFREFFYLCSDRVPNFGVMEGNPRCIQIPWKNDSELRTAWETGRTGYPFIDAVMTQLRTEGWVHHLARHSVACFLTRGDLFQHWEFGAEVFEKYLIDADWAINRANWQWLSASNFFYQYFRVYSPVAFGKKTDKEGLYIKKYLPVLAKFPTKYIYEPWLAPMSVQRSAGCIIGKDYPAPIVANHTEQSKHNMGYMKAAYAKNKKDASASTASRTPASSAKRKQAKQLQPSITRHLKTAK
eukprot:m.367506 g.367506  ORF g.367506 m.367506 type:complete len:333 (+) comp20834_c0_seq2:189-1187(+)